MTDDFWAITTFFNPMQWRRRLANFRRFRHHLRIPLVAVELGYDGRFELNAGDADILIQLPSHDVMWQKERLFNVGLSHVPPEVNSVACLDSDVIFERPDVWRAARRALDRSPITQLYSHVFYSEPNEPLDFDSLKQARSPAPGFAWLRQQGHTPLELCNPSWIDPSGAPPVTYGIGWAFRRDLFAKRGFYDAWIVGGGTRVHFFAAHGHHLEAAQAFQFHSAMHEHYRNWVEGFHADVRGQWDCVPGAAVHLWHGDMALRKHRQRYGEFAQFQFDPATDLALDPHGAWRWNSPKPEMHDYIRDYIAGRQEDDDAVADPVVPTALAHAL
jgi:hypothetical protein